MKINWRRVGAIYRKELREFRHNTSIVVTMAIIPLAFVVQPTIAVLVAKASSSRVIAHSDLLLYLLAIPALVPATLASYAIVGEREQGTLEPVLTTPITRNELLLGKGLAAFAPSIAVAYGVSILFVAVVEVFARPAVASAVIGPGEVAAQVVFTPLLAAFSVWVGIAVSARVNDVRTSQQLSLLASLPAIVVTSLVAYHVIPATPQVAILCGVALFVLLRVGWRITTATLDRERLIIRTK